MAPTTTLALRPEQIAQPNLLDLPNELLLEICRHLCWHCQVEHIHFKHPSKTSSDDEQIYSQSGLRSLVLASKRLQAIAEPFLYHSFEVSQNRGSDFYFFLRTLDSRPDLGRKMREFILSGYGLLPFFTRLPSSLGGARDPLHRRLLEEGFLPHDRGVGKGNAILLMVLLDLAPNLENFSLKIRGFDRARIRDSAVQASLLLSLKTLALHIDLNNFQHPFDHAEEILSLAPNLERLQLDERARSWAAWGPPTGHMQLAQLSSLPNLVELRLIDTRLTAPCLDTLLSAVGPRLSKVVIRRIAPEKMQSSWGGHGILHFDDVVVGLERWRDTLKELSFILYDGLDSAASQDFRRVNLLSEFRALEVLRADAGCFDFDGRVGPPGNALTSTLPESIHEFRLIAIPGFRDLVPGLRGFLDGFMAGRFGSLRKLETDDQAFHSRPRDEGVEEIGALFRSAGVDFILNPPMVKAPGPDI